MTAMNISLTPELDRFVRNAVEGGRYVSSSEVVREALRLLQDRQRQDEFKLDALRAELQHGLDSGPAAPLDMAKVRAKARVERGCHS
jgi:antitoxin ParD1/3/4